MKLIYAQNWSIFVINFFLLATYIILKKDVIVTNTVKKYILLQIITIYCFFLFYYIYCTRSLIVESLPKQELIENIFTIALLIKGTMIIYTYNRLINPRQLESHSKLLFSRILNIASIILVLLVSLMRIHIWLSLTLLVLLFLVMLLRVISYIIGVKKRKYPCQVSVKIVKTIIPVFFVLPLHYYENIVLRQYIKDNLIPFSCIFLLLYSIFLCFRINYVLKPFMDVHKTMLHFNFNIYTQVKRDFHITSREIEIIRQLLSGKSHRQIGNELYISPRTVDTHVNNIYRKCKISSWKELHNLIHYYSVNYP